VLSIVLVTRAFADVCNPNDKRLLKPDLVAEAPSKVRLRTLGGRVLPVCGEPLRPRAGRRDLHPDEPGVRAASGAGVWL